MKLRHSDKVGDYLSLIFSSCSHLSLISAYFAIVLFQELEKSLKATCEEFIMSITKLVVDPMLSFVTKVAISSHCRPFCILLVPFYVPCYMNYLSFEPLLCLMYYPINP
jgi:hypothetical protein